jgi:hypothetical protein
VPRITVVYLVGIVQQRVDLNVTYPKIRSGDDVVAILDAEDIVGVFPTKTLTSITVSDYVVAAES